MPLELGPVNHEGIMNYAAEKLVGESIATIYLAHDGERVGSSSNGVQRATVIGRIGRMCVPKFSSDFVLTF